MAEYLSPGVYVEEFDSGSSTMQGVSTSVGGFIGVAEKGSVSGTPELINNPAEFQRKFGGYLQESEFGEYRYLAYAVNHFFMNGGSHAYVMRVAPPDAKAAVSICADGQKGILDIQAKNPGAWGNAISISFNESSKCRTQILEDLGNGSYRAKNASGFEIGDVVELEGAGSPEYNVITSINEDTLIFEAPFAADVVDKNLLPRVTIHTCDMDIAVKYGDVTEKYDLVSFNSAAANFIEKRLAKSEIIDVQAKANILPIAPMDIVQEVFGIEKDVVKIALQKGSNGTPALLSEADFIGEDKGPGARTGIQAFLDNNVVNIMAIPGITSANVQLSLVSHCEKLANRFAVLDIPKESKTVNEIIAHRDIVDSDYCAMYHPWIEVFDPLDKKNTFIPPSGSIMGIYASTDNTRGVHKAPANEVVANCVGLYSTYNVGEQDILNPKGVNLIRRFPGAGIRVWGARTASSRPLWKYINVRRLFIFLEESIKANTNWVVFEPNDELLWIRVRRSIEIFLEGVWRTGALAGSSASDAFFVDIGPNTMSRDDIDNGRLICVIGVAPVKPAEFVIFRITQKTGE